MADDVVVIKIDDDDDDDIDEALERLERLVDARGLGAVAGRMQGLGTVVFIDVAPQLQARVEQQVLPELRALVEEVGLAGATVEIPPAAADDGDDDDEDDPEAPDEHLPDTERPLDAPRRSDPDDPDPDDDDDD